MNLKLAFLFVSFIMNTTKMMKKKAYIPLKTSKLYFQVRGIRQIQIVNAVPQAHLL